MNCLIYFANVVWICLDGNAKKLQVEAVEAVEAQRELVNFPYKCSQATLSFLQIQVDVIYQYIYISIYIYIDPEYPLSCYSH